MAGNGYVYGYTGPPFNFLGHQSLTQAQAFQSYVNARTGNFPAIQQFLQIRAALLRKTSGVLEKFYATQNDEMLSPTFNKKVWKPGPQGHFSYPNRDDHVPMIAMYQIKEYMKDQLQRQDESVFAMNQLHNLIEKTEDRAERAYLAVNPTQFTDNTISSLISKINGYFSLPEYEFVLVNDQKNVYPTGTTNPKGRVHQLDVPTQYEVELQTNAPAGQGPKTDLKEIGT